jgi:putative autotransporter adhesin-like protein
MVPTRICTLVLAGMVALSGCGKYSAIEGSGVLKTESRKVADFSAIDIGHTLRLQLQLGEKTEVEVSGDDNLVPLVQTKVTGDKLEIGFEGSYSTKLGLTVKVTTPKLTALSATGATSVAAAGLKGEKLKLQINGASNATLSGKLDALELDCSGASRVLAKELETKQAKVEASGASHVEVFASEQLEATATGASSIGYVGKPKKILPQAAGVSWVKELTP